MTATHSDPYRLFPIPVIADGIGATNIPGRIRVSPRIQRDEKTLIIATIGQSNIANSVEWQTQGKHAPSNADKVQNFNFINGGLYLAQDALMGCHGDGANMATWLGDFLVDRDLCSRAIFAPIAVSSSHSSQWAIGGDCNHRIHVLARRFLSVGYRPDFIIWHQGEADSGCATEVTRTNMQSMVDTVRAVGFSCPMFICQTSWTEDGRLHDAPRAAQRAIVDNNNGIYLGADTDVLGSEYRPDNQHFSREGAAVFAEAMFEKIAAYMHSR